MPPRSINSNVDNRRILNTLRASFVEQQTKEASSVHFTNISIVSHVRQAMWLLINLIVVANLWKHSCLEYYRS